MDKEETKEKLKPRMVWCSSIVTQKNHGEHAKTLKALRPWVKVRVRGTYVKAEVENDNV
jgi:hypothetical protein